MNATAAKRALKGKKSGQAATHAQAVKAVVQILFATSQSYTIDTLRAKLREFFLAESAYEKRAVASLSAVELMSALLEASPTLSAIGLKIRISNGVVQLSTSLVENKELSAFLAERARRTSELSPAALEVLACVAFRQPICQSEIDRLFGNVDKRHLVFVLREAGMIEEFVGSHGQLHFATTGEFLRHFGLESVDELKLALQEADGLEIQTGFMPLLD